MAGRLSAARPNTPEDETNDTKLDFGFQPVGTIGDTVFHDADGDGIYEPNDGDLPLAGVILTLTHPDGTIETTTTDATGYYQFTELPLNQTYEVTVDTSSLTSKDPNPTGDASLTADQTSEGTLTLSTTLTPENVNDPNLDFGFQPLGTIGDTIWHDTDADGLFSLAEGDIPLEGVVVILTDSNGMTMTTTTDANGTYLFEKLPLGDYTVTVDTTTLPNVKLTEPTFDPDGGPDGIGDNTSAVSLTPERHIDLDQDFGYRPFGTIGDTIWQDTDGDGVQDADESGIPGIVLILTDSNGITMTTTTDANGNYLFDKLPLGEYTVMVDTTTLPDELRTEPTFDPDGGPGGIGDNLSTVTLTPANPVDLEQDFGYQPSTLLGSIGDLIFHDSDGDGLFDEANGDFILPSVTVTLLDVTGTVIASTTTDANGNYLFDNLPMGDYSVMVDTSTLPAGKVTAPTADPDGGPDGIGDSVSQVSLTPANPDNREQDFGYSQETTLASLGNYYWIDADGDGIKDADEAAVVDALVTLFDADGEVVATATTDAYGFFSFAVEPGDYALGFELPNGYSFTQQDSGDGYDSDVDPRTGRTVPITIGPGQHDPNWGAGIVLGEPTAVNLSSFTVELRNDSEIVVRWTTSAELDTAGFHILRSSDGTLANARQVTSQLTPSQGSAGGSYEVVLPYDETLDAPLSALSFWLYEVEIGGGVNTYGPAVVDLDAAGMEQFMFLPFLSQ